MPRISVSRINCEKQIMSFRPVWVTASLPARHSSATVLERGGVPAFGASIKSRIRKFTALKPWSKQGAGSGEQGSGNAFLGQTSIIDIQDVPKDQVPPFVISSSSTKDLALQRRPRPFLRSGCSPAEACSLVQLDFRDLHGISPSLRGFEEAKKTPRSSNS